MLPKSFAQRSKAIAAGGPLLLVAVMRRKLNWERVLVGIFGVSIGIKLYIVLSSEARAKEYFLLASQIVFYLAVVLALLLPKSRTSLEIRANGLVSPNFIFCPWDQIRSYKWEKTHPDVLVIQMSKFGYLRYRIAMADKPLIDCLFREGMDEAAKTTDTQNVAERNAAAC